MNFVALLIMFRMADRSSVRPGGHSCGGDEARYISALSVLFTVSSAGCAEEKEDIPRNLHQRPHHLL